MTSIAAPNPAPTTFQSVGVQLPNAADSSVHGAFVRWDQISGNTMGPPVAIAMRTGGVIDGANLVQGRHTNVGSELARGAELPADVAKAGAELAAAVGQLPIGSLKHVSFHDSFSDIQPLDHAKVTLDLDASEGGQQTYLVALNTPGMDTVSDAVEAFTAVLAQHGTPFDETKKS